MRKFVLLFLTVLAAGSLFAQNRQVSGIVTNEEGAPLSGVIVTVKGTTTGAVTNASGEYSIMAPAGGTLEYSSLEMQNQEVAINNRTSIDVSMVYSTTHLDDVIVVAYGTATRETFTGSAGVVGEKEFAKRQVSNLTHALSGTVSGVQALVSNGQPGVDAAVRIRGVGSIRAVANPLYVVDGVPFDGSLSSINTSDIESMTVLKDAASAALYGSRAANGVIIVTTKKGRTGDARINFDARVGVNQRATRNYDVLQNPATYTEKVYEALFNGARYNSGMSSAAANMYANQVLPVDESGGIGYQIWTVPAGEQVIGLNGKLNPNATLGYSDGENYYLPDNWADNTFSNNMRQEYNLNVSGGSEKITYYASGGYLKDAGLIDNSSLERYTMRLRGDFQAKDWLKIGGNLSYTFSGTQYPSEQTTTNSSGNAFLMANQIAPVYPMYIRNADGSLMYDERGMLVYDYGDGEYSAGYRSFMPISNPVGDLAYNTEKLLSDIFSANWYVTANIVDGLSATARLGLDIDTERYNNLGNAFYGQSAAGGGSVYQASSRYFGMDNQYTLNYVKTFKNVHSIDIMAGYDGYTYKQAEVEASGDNLYNPAILAVSNTIDNRMGYGAANSFSNTGWIARANYNYDNKYFASVSFRRDGSSRFHKDNRWGNFWSASLAWVLNREKFMDNATWIDLLKFKASYGEQGNDKLGTSVYTFYAYEDQYSVTGSDGVFSDGTLVYKGNKDLTWEKSQAFNIGFDFEFWKGKLGGTVEYFSRQTSDMLYYKPVGLSAGYSEFPMNIGSMRNSGVEIELNSRVLQNNNMTLDIYANATFISNKIIKLHPDLAGKWVDGNRIYSEGSSMYRYYLVKYAGVDENTGEGLYWAKDASGNAYTTPDWSTASEFREPTDNMLPVVYGGFGATYAFYGFDASISFAYQLGGQIYDAGYQSLMHGGNSSRAGTNWHKDILNAWSETNRNTDVPRLDAQDVYTNQPSDRWMKSSNFLSINNIVLGYTLPEKWTSKIRMEKLRIYVAAENVALISARQGLDPRQSYSAATAALYTPIRTISGGLNLTF